MITKQYTVKLGNELHISRLTTSNSPKNSILLNISDKKQSLTEVSNKDFLEIDAEQLSNKAIKTNTTDVLATVINHNGAVYYFKHKKLSYPLHTITYNTNIYEPSGQLIYSNERYVNAEIRNSSGLIVNILEMEFVPVFIDKRMLNLKSYIDIDGKYFTPKRKGDSLMISFSKEISSYTIDNSIFKSEASVRNKCATIKLNDFLYVQNKTVNGLNSIIEYDYFNPVFSLIRKVREFIVVDKTGYIYLSNNNIDIDSIKMISVNDISLNIELGNLTNHSSGKICIIDLFASNTIGPEDLVEIEYNYLHKDEMYVNIDIRKLNKDSRMHSYVGATKISTPTEETKNERNFGVFISQNNFLVDNIFDYTTIDISQSGSEYLFDYTTQNQIVFNSANKIESFYANNIGALLSELAGAHLPEKIVRSIGRRDGEA